MSFFNKSLKQLLQNENVAAVSRDLEEFPFLSAWYIYPIAAISLRVVIRIYKQVHHL